MRWLYQAKAEPPPGALSIAEEVTLDKWFVPLAIPSPSALPLRAEPSTPVLLVPEDPVDAGWLVDLPTLLPLATSPPADYAWPLVDVVPLDAWYAALSEPVRDPAATFGDTLTAPLLVEIVEIVTLDKWYQPLSEPGLLPQLLLGEATPLLLVPEDPVATGWLSEWLPLPARVGDSLGESLAAPLVVETVEIVTLDKWYTPLALPIAPQHPAIGESSEPLLGDPTLDWLPTLELPHAPASPLEPTYTFPPLDSGELISLDKWYQPLSEPVPLPADVLWAPTLFAVMREIPIENVIHGPQSYYVLEGCPADFVHLVGAEPLTEIAGTDPRFKRLP